MKCPHSYRLTPGFIWYNRSEGLDPNGIWYPCVMGWGLAGTGNSSAVVVAPGGKMENHNIGLVFLEIGWKPLKNRSNRRKIRIWDGDLSIARIDPSWKVSMFNFRATSIWIHDVRKTSILVNKIQKCMVFSICPLTPISICWALYSCSNPKVGNWLL